MSEKPPIGQKNAYLMIGSQVHILEKNTFKIGRNLDNDLILENGFVSRFHAVVKKKAGQYYIKDLNSTSGTFLNATKISEGLLVSGDTIHIANVSITFVEEQDNEITEMLNTETSGLKKIRSKSKIAQKD